MLTKNQTAKEAVIDRLLKIEDTCDKILIEISMIRNILELDEGAALKMLKEAAESLNRQSIEHRIYVQRTCGCTMKIIGRGDDEF